jgi:ferredoxin
MPSVIINDVEMPAKVGEKLLGVARRNAAHIGFVCDGNGVCQTCQCRVLAGADQLSPPSEAELAWMPERRLAEGHRLACQTVIRGSGSIRLITKAEELRRQTIAALSPARDEYWRDNLEPLKENVARMAADQLRRYPWNVLAALSRVGLWRFVYPVRDEDRYLDDTGRVIRGVLAGGDRLGRPAAMPVTTPQTSAAALPPPPPRPVLDAEAQLVAAARDLRRAREAVRRYSR